ncbi:MAG: pyridoxal-dependent decarboxylase [Desulfobulbus propionicus]|nr:MAG: pyridoxal-dependent decarboxylase [Desulfobulbus propionicus]
METENVFLRVVDMLARYHVNRKEGDFVAYHEPDELRKLLKLDEEDKPGDLESLLGWVKKYLYYAVRTGNPGYCNRMWAGANLPSIIGEMVAAVSNTSACTFETAPVSTLMEQFMIQEMLSLVGFENGSGQMTTGSSNANMIAMMAARYRACPESKSQGLCNARPLRGFVNKDAHYSMDRAAVILGIGTDNLIKVPTDNHGRMDARNLAGKLAEAQAAGTLPFFVAATAGTTVRGAFDQLAPLLALRDQYDFWLHVDGAWGGAVVLSERLRQQFLPLLEQVDSFTLDFHKMPGTALMCNILLFNNSSALFKEICSAGDESYIFREGEDGTVRDLGTLSLQCGRRVDSLKWFLDWKFFGRKGLARRVEHYLELCTYAEQCIIDNPLLEMVAPRESYNVCFRHIIPEGQDDEAFIRALRTRMQTGKRGLIGIGYVDGTLALRLLVTNTSIGRREIRQILDNICLTAREISEEIQRRIPALEN